MGFLRILALILSAILLPAAVSGTEPKEYVLENGLKILILEEHKAPVATFQIWYRVGSRNEPLGKSGLSHLLEHMMFKGTHRYGPSELTRLIQKNGGTDNAYTTKEYTAYFALMPSDRITLPIELEADRMRNLILDPQEVISERNVVMEERRLRYEDDPQNSLYEEVVAAAFKVHPYQRPVIGWMSDLKSIRQEDLMAYYRQNYSPDKAVIVVVGDVDPGEMLREIRTAFGGIKAKPGETTRLSFEEPAQVGEKRITIKRDAELPYLLVAYHVPSFPHEDGYALDVLNLILSGGKSTRLYQHLVYEQKVALTASASYSGFYGDPFLFFFSSTAAPGKDVREVEESLNTEIEKIKSEHASAREVQKAKNQIEASFIFDQDSIFMQAMNYGMFEMLGGWRQIDRYLEEIRKVTPEDVMRVAKKYFRPDNRTVGILVPEKSDSAQEENHK
jgi:zinc protease